jgi:hypothetical protein
MQAASMSSAPTGDARDRNLLTCSLPNMANMEAGNTSLLVGCVRRSRQLFGAPDALAPQWLGILAILALRLKQKVPQLIN